jgi:hypothetical protein
MCGQSAVLVVTGSVEGTSTHVARRRLELRCQLAVGHSGAHYDPDHGERWDGTSIHPQTLLRHEDDTSDP